PVDRGQSCLWLVKSIKHFCLQQEHIGVPQYRKVKTRTVRWMGDGKLTHVGIPDRRFGSGTAWGFPVFSDGHFFSRIVFFVLFVKTPRGEHILASPGGN